jgi:hypothetical protein
VQRRNSFLCSARTRNTPEFRPCTGLVRRSATNATKEKARSVSCPARWTDSKHAGPEAGAQLSLFNFVTLGRQQIHHTVLADEMARAHHDEHILVAF